MFIQAIKCLLCYLLCASKESREIRDKYRVFFPSSVKFGISRHRWHWMITGVTLYAKYPKHQYIQVKLALKPSKAKSVASCQKRSGEVHLTNFRVMTVKMTSSREKLTTVQFMSKLLEKTSSAKVWCCLENYVDVGWLFKMVPQLAILNAVFLRPNSLLKASRRERPRNRENAQIIDLLCKALSESRRNIVALG